MLNDVSRRTRLYTFVMGLSVGLVFGPLVATIARPLDVGTGSVIAFPVAAIVVMVLASNVMFASLYLDTFRFWEQVVIGSQEIVAGTVSTVSVPGRVLTHRISRGRPHFSILGGRQAGEGLLLPVTVVGDGPPRRVALLAPVLPALQHRDAPLVVALHPERPEVGVLDDRVGVADLEAAAHDPRWADRLPTNGSTAGGWGKLVACGLAGALVAGVPVFALLT
ncbi:hypothetical protein GHK92_11480 [Nocardioides sp. dk4132]|uniref:hypothetical protein n=1 Tax=Nocardioides TaxID=1839 RepID=UPI0012969EFB|nr:MULTISPECIES: hypothetical protein [Nocardioides]MQW76498.1 hypothetical protein [Nocardioides sp. dk4132]QGA07241.1 hypothetical protein GFH29_07460 [Nocardioides sp. dk884]